MIDFSAVRLNKIVVHKVGNKLREEGIKFSENPLKIESEILEKLLLKYFLLSFAKTNSFYRFFHEDDLKFNEIYSYVNDIFNDFEQVESKSKKIAIQLYEKSMHPKINKGEFYIIHLSECAIDDEVFDAIGIFKTENKDTYLRVQEKEDNFEIDYENGININKLDKGCLVFNTEKDNGFIVSVIDNVNKSNEAQYWKDNFLKIKPREDNYYFTTNYLNMCKDFVDKGIKDIEKTEQIELKNNTMDYFAEKDTFNVDDFKNEVISNPETKQAFKEYVQDYQNENDILLAENFDISPNAVKKEKRKFKSVIKLDKNYDIYIRANHTEVENGYDENKAKKYYKLYYDSER